jgi:hypothetical protein
MKNQKRFFNQEQGFTAWIQLHASDGFVLNCHKGRTSEEAGVPYMLHEARCPTLNGVDPRTGRNYTTSTFYKVCSTDRDGLDRWAREAEAGPIRLCKRCLGR